MEAFNYQFTALRGMQAGREYYTVMCPLKLIPKIFLFDEEEIPAELRAQRVLNRARIPEIARYIIDNPTAYVFSSITASIDGNVRFEPREAHGAERNVGTLTVPMTARFLINDGQHRRAAIEEALKANPQLGDETVSVVFFVDAGLERSQQMFADLNKHAVRPTRSIGILYDRRDPMAQVAYRLSQQVPVFKGLTEIEKTTISNRSTKLFTLSAIYQATHALLQSSRGATLTRTDEDHACEFWTVLGDVIPEWRQIIQRQVSAAQLRSEYVHAHGVALHAFGIAGHSLVATYPDDWRTRLNPLGTLNWLRTNPVWEGRAMYHGKMSKAGLSVQLTANLIKQTLGLKLSAEEVAAEQQVKPTVKMRSVG
ncbi:DNA sulfur modification protein DndB [Candidatus Chloroploca sp. Khr17]|uniref:DNA sulfur modification protein DndB n=1 Tax=Candidatus Chloroploca sp. Khr17 TaxID=2496869 RepID=UPI00101CE03C|nr:DNA sulfur modification protein DndB [Candidatus Chloroploca sp. Khr17]